MTENPHEPTIRSVENLARLLDSQFRIPFTQWRWGIDTLIGLVPGLGDTLGLFISLYIIANCLRTGIPLTLVGVMLLNVLLDWAVGSIPLIGDIFDLTWKANNRNAGLLRAWHEGGAFT